MAIRSLAALAASALLLGAVPVAAQTSLLNVSYDPTRELYQEINAAFVRHTRKGPVRR